MKGKLIEYYFLNESSIPEHEGKFIWPFEISPFVGMHINIHKSLVTDGNGNALTFPYSFFKIKSIQCCLIRNFETYILEFER